MRITPFVVSVLLSASLGVVSFAEEQTPRATLIEARNLAYDANFRNDQAGLRSAIASLQPLASSPEVAAYAHYYLSWAHWALAASQVQEKNTSGALESGRLAVEHARSGLLLRDTDPEFQTALVNALVVVGFLDGSQFKTVLGELTAVRRKAVEQGPRNPRVVLMDAGAIFNSPPEAGGSRERGLARWEEALSLFEAESNATMVDPIVPRWGYALAQGWMATLYLRMTPPQKENARRAADAALRMRPDFWWVRDQVLPQLRE
jgi:hypothetical protein